MMESLLRLYRKLLDSTFVPNFFSSLLEKVGLRIYFSLFRNRHKRLAPYTISYDGKQRATLFLDWFDYTDSSYLFFKTFEVHNVRCMQKLVDETSACIDAGANIGYFSILMGKLAPHGKVLAIEPAPRNIRSLTQNIEANKLSQVKIAKVALGKENGSHLFEHKLLNSGSGTISSFKGEDTVIDEYIIKEECPVKTLSELWNEEGLSTVRLMKMDIQGGEMDALEGAKELLQNKKIEYMIIEYNSYYYGDQIAAFLAHYGYAPYAIRNDGSLSKIEAKDLKNKSDYVFTYK